MEFLQVFCDYHPEQTSQYVCSQCSLNICHIDVRRLKSLEIVGYKHDEPIRKKVNKIYCINCHKKETQRRMKVEVDDYRRSLGIFVILDLILFYGVYFFYRAEGMDALPMIGIFGFLILLFSLGIKSNMKKYREAQEKLYEKIDQDETTFTPKTVSRMHFREPKEQSNRSIDRRETIDYSREQTQRRISQQNSSLYKFETEIYDEHFSKDSFQTLERNNLIIIFSIFFALFYLFGAYATIKYLIKSNNIFELPYMEEVRTYLSDFIDLDQSIATLSIGVILLFLGIGVLIGFVNTYLVGTFGKYLRYLPYFVLFIIITALPFVLSLFFPWVDRNFLYINLIVVLPLIVFIVYSLYKNLKESEISFFDFTAQIIKDHPQIILIQLVLEILTFLTEIFMWFSFVELSLYFDHLKELELFSFDNRYIEIPAIIFFELAFLILYITVYNIFITAIIIYATRWSQNVETDLKEIRYDLYVLFPKILMFSFLSAIIKQLLGDVKKPSADGVKSSISLKAFVLFPISWFIKKIFNTIWEFLDSYVLMTLIMRPDFTLKKSVEQAVQRKWYGMIDVITSKEAWNNIFSVSLFINTVFTGMIMFISVLLFDNFIEPLNSLSPIQNISYFLLLFVFTLIPAIITFTTINNVNKTFVWVYVNSVLERKPRPDHFPREIDTHLLKSRPELFNPRYSRTSVKRKMKNPLKYIKSIQSKR